MARRLLLAATAAPIVAAFVAAAPAMAIFARLDYQLGLARPGEPSLATFAGAYISVALITSAIGLAMTFTLGLAWHVYASRRGWTSAAAYAAAGALAGLALGSALIAAMFKFDFAHLWPCAVWGSCVGALTGFLARRMRG